MKNFLIIAVSFLLFAIIMYAILKSSKVEKNQINHQMVVQQVEELGRLELLRYNIRDVVIYEKMRTWLPNSKTVLIAVGEVVSCVDLTKITGDDVRISGDSVSLILPVPEICYFKIDHSRSQIYDIQYGFFDTHKLVDEAYSEAEQQIYQQALQMGIADESRSSAITLLTPMLRMLGFKRINIDFKQSGYQIESDKLSINPKNLLK